MSAKNGSGSNGSEKSLDQNSYRQQGKSFESMRGIIRYVKWTNQGQRSGDERSVPADRAICIQYRADE
ncbi:MAG: hypothetical protein ABEK50_09850 [bacterium]